MHIERFSHGMCLYQVMMTLHFLNDVVNDLEFDTKIDNYVTYVIIATTLESEPTCKLIKSQTGSCFLYQVGQARL